MRITAIETLHRARGVTVHAGPIQWLWVRIHTDEGVVGLGETYPRPEAEAAVVHGSLAPVLLGRNPLQIDRLWAEMFASVSPFGWAGAEMRAMSAVDIALWDLKGKVLGQPVYELLGGASRESIPTYNTCYDHLDFHTQPVELARELLSANIRAMKIWPFDSLAKETGGQRITADQLRRGFEPLRQIREAVGDSMDVALEFHGFWNLPSAIRIAREAEELEPMWLEEMLPQDNMAAYRELASNTRLPLTISERLLTKWSYRELVENRAASILMPDISWCGGLTEAKKIATLAETYYLPVAPHNCGGPVLHFATAHLAANLTHLYLMESVRRHYLDEYRGILTRTLLPLAGAFPLPKGPGLGVELDPTLEEDPTLISRKTE